MIWLTTRLREALCTSYAVSAAERILCSFDHAVFACLQCKEVYKWAIGEWSIWIFELLN